MRMTVDLLYVKNSEGPIDLMIIITGNYRNCLLQKLKHVAM